MRAFRRALALVALAAALAPAMAQDAAPRRGQPAATPPGPQAQSPTRAAAPQGEARRLPADSVTHHAIRVGERTLAFTATAGSLLLTNDEGRPEIEMAYVAYVLDGQDRRTRPVTFALNGGPGSASAWLHVGLMGPWRVALEGEGARPSALSDLQINAETWLDATDLVFVDPAGTGFSRIVNTEGDARQRIYSTDGDVETIATFIRRWTIAQNRATSPKLFVGESYAGFRGPRVADSLQRNHGIGLAGLVLVSPVLDFGWLWGSANNPFSWAGVLPSMVATARDAPTLGRADLADVEAYARGEFVADFLRGRQDRQAVGRIVERVSALTGLPRALVERLGGRVDSATFRRERSRAEGVVGSAYDATITGIDPFPNAFSPRFPDPFTTALTAPVTTAMMELYGERLNYRPSIRYFLSNGNVNSSWQWGRGRFQAPEATTALTQALALDPSLRVIVAHGLSDLVTPYFQSRLLLDQLPPFATPERVRLLTYGGGHMFYSRDASRVAFRRDVEEMFRVIAKRGE